VKEVDVSISYNCFSQLIHHVNKCIVPEVVDNPVEYPKGNVGNLNFFVVSIEDVDKFSNCQRVTYNLYRDLTFTFHEDKTVINRNEVHYYYY
jgi:UDP-glucose 4-epimerase